jgi:hypothetical protein
MAGTRQRSGAGTLLGCSGERFTKVTYTTTMKTQDPVSCAVLEQEEPVEGPANFEWTPTAKASTGRLATVLFESDAIVISGEVLTGGYSPLTFSSEGAWPATKGRGQRPSG